MKWMILIVLILSASCAVDDSLVRQSFYDDTMKAKSLAETDGDQAAFVMLKEKYRDGDAFLTKREKEILHVWLGNFSYKSKNYEIALDYFSQAYSESIVDIERKEYIRKTANASFHNIRSTLSDEEFSVWESQYYKPLLIIVDIRPVYPKHVAEEKIEGYALLQFTVTEQGKVTDIQVVEAKPEGVFEEAAINAARNERYKPTIINGFPVKNTLNRKKYTFNLVNEL